MNSARLTYRKLQKGDECLLFPLHSDPAVMIKIKSPDKSIEQTSKRVQQVLNYMQKNQGLGHFLAFYQGSFIGWGALGHIEENLKNPIEIGYRLHKNFWGQGFATEVATSLRNYAKNDLGLNKLSAIAAEDNIASIKVLKKIGMQWQQVRKYHGLYLEYFEMDL